MSLIKANICSMFITVEHGMKIISIATPWNEKKVHVYVQLLELLSMVIRHAHINVYSIFKNRPVSQKANFYGPVRIVFENRLVSGTQCYPYD